MKVTGIRRNIKGLYTRELKKHEIDVTSKKKFEFLWTNDDFHRGKKYLSARLCQQILKYEEFFLNILQVKKEKKIYLLHNERKKIRFQVEYQWQMFKKCQLFEILARWNFIVQLFLVKCFRKFQFNFEVLDFSFVIASSFFEILNV